MARKIWIRISVACVVAGLAGCGESPPGDGDVREAMSKQIEQVSGRAGAESQKEELAKIKVGNCAKADLGGFKCEFTAGAGAQTGRFKKGNKGWELVGVGG
ncbi:hypothetical protein [Massilia sp. TWP1-3-3]|uniref:hypothetical protein n=1 Tax=Massilia sp. TWP1-3-3 TaxID=2804573 RepID=UPI003CEF6E0E